MGLLLSAGDKALILGPLIPWPGSWTEPEASWNEHGAVRPLPEPAALWALYN